MKHILLFILAITISSCKSQSTFNKVHVPVREFVTILNDTTLEIQHSFESNCTNKLSVNIVNDELTLEVLNRYNDVLVSYTNFFVLGEPGELVDTYIFQNEYSTIKLSFNKRYNKVVNISIRDIRHLTIQNFIL